MMMQGIRNAGKTWLGKLLVGVLFALLIGSFAIWGIGDVFRGQSSNAVATVGKSAIEIERVRTAYQIEVQRASRRFRQNITPEQARLLGIDRQVLSRLVTETALDLDASTRGLTISNALVAQAILDDQNFRGPSGRFERGIFDSLLQQSGLNEAGYVREQRMAMLRGQIAEAVAGQVSAPVAMQEAAHRHRNEQRVLAHLRLDPSMAGEIAEPAEATLRTYFDERKATFRAPEYRTAQVLVLTPQTLADPLTISDADAVAHYEATKSRYGQPERRTVQQIVFPSQPEAAAALAKIRTGTSFEDIARERSVSETDLTLGSFARAEMLDQSVAAAAFALAAGVVSEPVAGAFGYALLRVPTIEAGQVRPFAEVAGTVRTDLALTRAGRLVTDVHDKIEDMRASARPLSEISAELKLSAVTLGPIDRALQLAGGQPAPSLPALQQLVEAMFRADVGTDNEALRTPDGGYVWFDVSGIEPSRDRTFDEVKPMVVNLWRQDEVASRLQSASREIIDRVGKGETFAAVAASRGLALQTSPVLTRTANEPGFPANVLTVAFGTPVNGMASAELGAGAGRIVMQVQSATTTPFLRTTQEAESVGQQLGVALGDDLLAQYVTSLQNRMGVSINQQALRNATGGGES